MNILILSDSHGHPNRISLAVGAQLEKPRAIFYLGDGIGDLQRASLDEIPVESVPGNCDFMCGGLPSELVSSLGGFRFLLCHGHTLGVKYGLEKAIARAASSDCDVLLYGHTHKYCEGIIPAGTVHEGVTLKKPLLIFNPGSIAEGSFGTAEIRYGNILFGHGNI